MYSRRDQTERVLVWLGILFTCIGLWILAFVLMGRVIEWVAG